jgi:ABC-type lipoprotein export system ATPase subunit
LLELNKTEKQSFVIVTHNDRFAKRSDRNFMMADGKLLQI